MLIVVVVNLSLALIGITKTIYETCSRFKNKENNKKKKKRNGREVILGSETVQESAKGDNIRSRETTQKINKVAPARKIQIPNKPAHFNKKFIKQEENNQTPKQNILKKQQPQSSILGDSRRKIDIKKTKKKYVVVKKNGTFQKIPSRSRLDEAAPVKNNLIGLPELQDFEAYKKHKEQISPSKNPAYQVGKHTSMNLNQFVPPPLQRDNKNITSMRFVKYRNNNNKPAKE